MMLKDFPMDAFMQGVADAVADQINKALASRDAVILELKAQIATKASRDDVESAVTDSVSAAARRLSEDQESYFKSIQPKDGQDGKDGTSIDIDEVRALVKSEVEAAVGALPKPENGQNGKDGADGKDGKDGIDGKDGRDGIDGKDGINGKDGADGKDGAPGADGKDGESVTHSQVVEAVRSLIQPVVESHLKANPPAQGDRGPEGPPGRDGRDGLPGVPGEKGRDGINGKDGIDGKDGFSLKDLSIYKAGDREIVFKFADDSITKEVALSFPVMLYRGIWQDGNEYKQGDAVTNDGCLWVAIQDTSSRPKESNDWKMAAKSGRNGKDYERTSDDLPRKTLKLGGKK